ncbi:MAG: PRC-barrel domain-containing protein [Fuscovulum sp.]|jgi:hypothetical protein|nr:PRC-barrel domain-containing protein [Paracoccaceae bacterium]MCZ8084309.1 PRC-barrel domain-containing protein [Paracoccaceae bacterium]WRH61591.1 MAG: PRC-barrel domain-containing protein [Fuscovulum sp.]
MDHSTHTRLADAELTDDIISDAAVYGRDDEKIGTVSHLHGVGAGSQVIVDVGGFLGIGAKPVALMTSELAFMRDESGTVHATSNHTKDELSRMPEHHH